MNIVQPRAEQRASIEAGDVDATSTAVEYRYKMLSNMNGYEESVHEHYTKHFEMQEQLNGFITGSVCLNMFLFLLMLGCFFITTH